MRPTLAAAQTQRLARRAIIEIPLVWISATHRETGEVHGLGVWRGPDDETITVPDYYLGINQTRYFAGRGDLLSVSGVRYESGFNFRAASIALSGISPTVKQALRFYEPHGAEVQVWRRSYNPETRKPLGVELWFPGTVDTLEFTRPAPGGESTAVLDVVSTARMLTITSAGKRSNEAQRARAPGDLFRRYKATIAETEVPWASARERQDDGDKRKGSF